MKNLILTCLLIIAITDSIHTQGYDTGGKYDTLGPENRAEMARQAIMQLKEGVLIVRLKTGSSKIEAMQRVANSPSVSEEDRLKFEERIADYQKDLQEENSWLIGSLKEYYQFSEVLFMPDTTAAQLIDGARSGFFLNENLEIDRAISLSQRPYLVMYYGTPVSSGKSGIEGLVFLDENMQELVEPFPYFTGVTTIKRTLGKFFNKKGEDEFFDEMVVKLQKRLDEFYEINN